MLGVSLLWVALATAVVAAATIRKFAAQRDDDCPRAGGTERRGSGRPVAAARSLGVVDQWGNVFTALALLYGVLLLSGFVYVSWQNSQQILK